MSTQFDDSRNDPAKWTAACRRLLNTLNVIERGIASSDDIERSDAELSAMMIAGFAFENAFKAWFLKNGGILYASGKQTDLRQHSFTSWAAKHQIIFQGSEAEALDKAEFFCVAWGRYPAHNRMEKERAFESWSWSEIVQIKNLVHRLLHETNS